MTAAAAALDPNRRRPESDSADRYRARMIQAAFGAGRSRAGTADVREAVRAQVDAHGLPGAVAAQLTAALAKRADASDRQVVLSLVRSDSFLGLDPRTQARLLARLAPLPTGPTRAAQKIVELEALPRLAPSVRRLVVDAATEDDPLLARHLPELLSAPGLATLPEPAQRDVVRYFVGPSWGRRIAPMRKNRMRLAWQGRRQDLLTLVRSARFRTAAPPRQGDELSSFLHQPTQSLFVLDATPLNGHAVVVLGAPDDRRAISYGRRWVAARGGGWPQPRLYAPDPTVHSGWQRPAHDARTPYASRAYRLSRFEVWRLIGWIESGFVVSDDQRVAGLGPAPVGGDLKRFVASVEHALAGIVADEDRRRGKPGCHLAGQPHQVEPDADEADALLAAYLKS